MSDDLSSLFVANHSVDAELEADLERFRSVSQDAEQKGFLESAPQAEGSAPNPVMRWIQNLPKNITVGVMDAAMNTIGFFDDLNAAAESSLRKKEAGQAKPVGRFTPQKLREQGDVEPLLSPELMEAARALRADLARDSNLADEVTQSAAQFFIPFGAFLKGLSGIDKASKGATVARGVAAESATMLTAFEPHEARFADLLRRVDTENRLVNAYIDFMAADQDEGEWEGRLKNVLDSLAVTGGVAAVIKAGGSALKAGRNRIAKGTRTTEAADGADTP